MKSPLRIFATFAVFALASAAICGCGHVGPAWKSDIANVREEHRLEANDLYERVQNLERDIMDLKRGYRTIPVNVTITNAWEATSCQ